MSHSHRALVTGGTGGIGASIVAHLTDLGIEVEAPGRDRLDLLDRESVSRFLAGDAAFDILINNAGINELCSISEFDFEKWDRMLEINLAVTARLMQGCLPCMRERQWGLIVNIASIYGRVVRESRGIYSATKAGLIHLTSTVAVEEAENNILVNSLSPGFVDTALTRQNNSKEKIAELEAKIPLGRMAQPCEIAEFVGYLSSEKNTYLTGQDIAVDGGYTIQ